MSTIPFKCPYQDFSCVLDGEHLDFGNCKICPHKTTHGWLKEEGIAPNTDIYKMPNGLRVIHDKDKKRAYVQSPDNTNKFSPIDTSTMSVDEWEQTLLGIEKLEI